MDPIKPPQSLMELTAERIREAIIRGELPLGSKVSEQKLADTLRISRSPVREALALLQIEGLIRVLPKRGSFVFTPDEKTVDDLCDHRSCLERSCLEFALERDAETLLVRLRKGIDEMQTAISRNDSVAYSMADMRFHRAIVACSGNHSMAKVYESTIGPLMALRTHLFTEMKADIDVSMAQHVALLSACEARDLQLGQEIIKQHVRKLTEHYRASVLDETPRSPRRGS